MDLKEKQNIADNIGGESLESEHTDSKDANEPISKSLQNKIDALEKKKSLRRSIKLKRGGSMSPDKSGQRSPSPGASSYPREEPGSSSYLPDISPRGNISSPGRKAKPSAGLNKDKLKSDDQLDSLENINEV